MTSRNELKLSFSAKSENEALARVAIGAFISNLDPTMDELDDVRTVISEAVTNAIIHGYEEDPSKQVVIEAVIENNEVQISVSDTGLGIEDIDLARQPLFTSKPELERSGMGFSIMETFLDKLEVTSKPGEGTTVFMKKHIVSKTRSTARA
ncbi:anti-sigma F factor [Paenibacillus yanchengensis]|uniref:Anti-sigma F factor n=1 Tax=Paenibacillus yanchengensis TaxID=2035833 RepID=A0ABW4YK46_9BACL